jgi:DNA-binding response OmpR family regulator
MNSPDTKLVLVIDDDYDAKEMVETALCTIGFRTLSVPTRDEAVGVISNETPDLIIMDCMMPGMSAPKFLEWLRRDRKTPVILMTALADGANRAQQLGVNKYFKKPFDIIAMIESAKQLVGK